ncbi:hypothetical protein Sipo8835_26115 [Streptomyces ipomoeae]|uniref:Uncharacterized protein n=1 Tax=Streptomyces ipomoeae TaxID=103232 RepID=A0AAE8VZK9_9ACTN|nr:DUF6303 family protein [Streptomyces ipomoeae]TQE28297.1 hypothetical protein Sipo8835_26115 [Streptomyces ipomoeae]
MADVFTAQMSMRKGRWCLYVVLMNTTERWPEYRFGPVVPTFTDRVNALTALGYEPLPDAAWEWTEDTETPDDPSSPVILIAAIGVRSRRGAGA